MQKEPQIQRYPALVRFLAQPQESAVSAKLPKRLRTAMRKLRPIQHIEQNGSQWEIMFSFSAEESPFFQKEIAQAFTTLRKKGVGAVGAPFLGEVPRDILPVLEGRGLFACFCAKAAEAALEPVQKKLRQAKVTVIDGGDPLVFSVLERMAKKTDHLHLLTSHGERFTEIGERLYDEYGLVLGVFATEKHRFLQEADVVIACGKDGKDYSRLIAPNTVWLDMGKDAARISRLAKRREDIFLADGICLDGKTDRSAEAALYCQSEAYRNFFDSGYRAGWQEGWKLAEEVLHFDGFLYHERKKSSVFAEKSGKSGVFEREIT